MTLKVFQFLLNRLERIQAEALMNNFVKSFLVEIERIESIYLRFLKQYNDEFTSLKERYLKKQSNDEMD
jgi:hypothetical protein